MTGEGFAGAGRRDRTDGPVPLKRRLRSAHEPSRPRTACRRGTSSNTHTHIYTKIHAHPYTATRAVLLRSIPRISLALSSERARPCFVLGLYFVSPRGSGAAARCRNWRWTLLAFRRCVRSRGASIGFHTSDRATAK